MPAEPTHPDDKVPTRTKLGYGAGMVSQRVQMNGFSQMANPIFNDILGVDPRLVGIVMGASRVLGAGTDLIVGYLSDRVRTRFGRRRPWIAASAILCSLSFAAIWLVPRGMSDGATLAWFTVTSLCLFFSHSLFSVPYEALGMELTPDYHERTSVMAFREVIAKSGGFLVSSIFAVVTLSCFDDIAHGMKFVGIAFGVVILITTLCPAIFTRERPLRANRHGSPELKISLLASFRLTLANPPFLILLGASAVMLLGLMMVNHLSYYLIIYHMFGGIKDSSAGMLLVVNGYAAQLGGIIGIPLMAVISRRIGKRPTLLIALVIAFVSDLLKWVCFTPTHPYLSMIPAFIAALALAWAWTLFHAMLPDVVDFDELKTGQRREGMFSAIHGWVIKVAMAIALIASGFLLDATGFDAAFGPSQDPHSIIWIKTLYTLIPAAAMLLGFIIIYFYPLSDARCLQIRKDLESSSAQ